MRESFGPPIGTYPFTKKTIKAVRRAPCAVRRAPLGPELSVCSMYGHCYCVDKMVANKTHKVCCMCDHQHTANDVRWTKSFQNEQSMLGQHGTDLSRMVFD